MLGQMFQGDFIILDYYTHQQKYAELCVNKDKPQMHCNGSCQMHQKLQKAHQQESNNPEATGGFKVNIVLYCVLDNLHFTWKEIDRERFFPFPAETEILQGNLSNIFRPPIFCA